MKNKVIFELKLDKEKSLIAYEKVNYEKTYEVAFLVLKTKYRKIKLVESSFCYGFGAEMYYRIHNMNEIETLENFTTLLQECIEYNSRIDSAEVEPKDFDSKYYFVGYKSRGLYLAKLQDTYALLLVKFFDKDPNKFKVKIMKVIAISSENFLKWQPIIKNEWECRAIVEGTRDNDISSNREDWEEYFKRMRS